MLDEDVRYEAISAALGSSVRPLAEFQRANQGKTPDNLLTVDGFLIGAALGVGSLLDWLNPVSWVDWMFSFISVSEIRKQTASATEFYIDEDKFFDRQFDHDFTQTSDTQDFKRGGEKYTRPCGWYRIALKVLDKYGDNTWLGPNGIRTQSSAGEWPVSYHGSSKDGAEGIIVSHYKAGNNSKRQVYGRGIYSTPDLEQARGYANVFVSKKNGKTYKIILQNRVNPDYREKHRRTEDYWLVPVPEGSSETEERKIVERAIRPYGILIKEV
ncbi:uncharacterized protein [Osmerus mordax]|uniref:uncharacterized protein n=1 Tax=Osmerus mordax TaxID=8014 RepID=UPI00350EA904